MIPLWIATAGWAIPRGVAERFPPRGSGLQRYAACFSAVEINSTFYRSHRASTYARWHASTPAGFRFAVKLPKSITHQARLVDANELVAAFRDEVFELKDKLGPLLVQLPPSLGFAAPIAERFWASRPERRRCSILRRKRPAGDSLCPRDAVGAFRCSSSSAAILRRSRKSGSPRMVLYGFTA